MTWMSWLLRCNIFSSTLLVVSFLKIFYDVYLFLRERERERDREREREGDTESEAGSRL